MPLLTAQKKCWTKQPPYNFYHFPEEHRAGWEKFWKEMDGDAEKVLDFAKKADIECPPEWFESLHRFLFGVFCGNPKLLKQAASKDFNTFVGQTAKNHQNEPKERDWYTIRGVTHPDFVAMLERAAEVKDVRQAVAFINARVKDFGFFLYSEYVLSKTEGKSEIKSVASNLNKQAYELECAAIGESPIGGLDAGCTIVHALFPEDQFNVTEVIRKDNEEIETLVTQDKQGHVAFIGDIWNVQAL